MPMRLLAVADVYEALTSERPCRPAMSSEQALALIRDESPQALDDAATSALGGLVHDPSAPGARASGAPGSGPPPRRGGPRPAADVGDERRGVDRPHRRDRGRRGSMKSMTLM